MAVVVWGMHLGCGMNDIEVHDEEVLLACKECDGRGHRSCIDSRGYDSFERVVVICEVCDGAGEIWSWFTVSK